MILAAANSSRAHITEGAKEKDSILSRASFPRLMSISLKRYDKNEMNDEVQRSAIGTDGLSICRKRG